MRAAGFIPIFGNNFTIPLHYLEELNEAQRKAVEALDGPVMIIAGAGSGKTRVLTYRIAHLMRSRNVDAFNILALTFTNKAAREMRNRIETLAGGEARNLWMGTFHSVFARVLRVEAEKLGYPSNFSIYDTDDSRSLLKDIIKEHNLDDKLYRPDMVHNRISGAKNNLISADEYLANSEIMLQDTEAGRPKLGYLYKFYTQRCFKSAGMDFDDLLFNMYRLIDKFPDALYKYQHKFHYLMVDEFQDTNPLQYMIVKKLAALNENISVVGDDAQSIYAFRGATIKNILTFKNDYPDVQVFKLEQNYRSTKMIVSAANSIIRHNKDQHPKEVWTHNDTGNKIRLLRALTDNEEGNNVAHSIFEEKINNQLHNRDFAILYRTNAQSRAMEEALRRLNIPYRIYGGLSFYKRKEIKDMLSYFRLVINNNDEEALKRIINVPARGIGKTTVDKLIVTAAEAEVSPWEVLSQMDKYNVTLNFNTGIRQKLNDFMTMVRSHTVKLSQMNAYDLASGIASSSGLLKEFYEDKTPEGMSRYENIQELLNAIKEFTVSGKSPVPAPQFDNVNGENISAEPVRTLPVFMQDIALFTDADDEDGDDDKVSLMTVHSAKGLEFPHVYIVGLEENMFPSAWMLDDRADLEEERRLFYVAVTRAEIKLTLSYAESRYRWGKLISCEPSRFLTEVDEKCVEAASIKRNTFGLNNFNSLSFEDRGRTQYSTANSRPQNEKRNPKQTTNHKPQTTNPQHLKRISALKNSSNGNPFTGDDAREIQVGMDVEHQRFGDGKVMLVEGNYPDIKATVFFQGLGHKQLLLRFAKLKIKSKNSD
jgi:DNA helicase-2/ATP-dependent DNA helicase PcrA